MSGFQPPISIDSALQRIDNNEYLLPAFQREFKWKSKQIERLFDSLMQGYPINSMLFWKVKGETKTKWKFYKFIDSFVLDARGYPSSNSFFNTTNSNDFFAILDGQQRLTALRIGIYGSYAYHESQKSWDYSEKSFPKRVLYLNISREGGIDDECKYFFEFKKCSETNEETFYKDSKGDLWFKVWSVVAYHKSGDDAGDYFADVSLSLEQKRRINALKYMIFNERTLTYYEEEDQNSDKAVEIFTRINSGGTYLDFSDIVFSLIVSNWGHKDVRTETENLFNTVENKGFNVDKKYIVKVFLYLYNASVKTVINSFDKKFCSLLENNWDKISESIFVLFDLLKSYGLSGSTLTSNNATLPILYYIYHTGKYKDDFVNKIGYKEDREKIRKWLLSSILRKTFGGQVDSILQQSRKFFTEDIYSSFIKEGIEFDGPAINSYITRNTAMDDEFFEGILNTQKDNCYAFPILSILYPYLDYSNNNDWHKDHLHPKDLYKALKPELQEKYPFKVYDSIINLQMLDGHENESKKEKSLKDWIDSSCLDSDSRERFLASHLIPDVDLSLDNIDEFFIERKKMLIARLKELII